MIFKIINDYLQDYFLVFGDNIKCIQDVAESGIIKRGWKKDDCYSEEIK